MSAGIAIQSISPRFEPLALIKRDSNDSRIDAILFAADGRYLLSRTRGRLPKLWKYELPNGLGTGQTGGIGVIKIWEMPRGNLVRTIQAHYGGIVQWTVNNKRALLATGDDVEETVKLWEIPSGRVLHTVPGTHPSQFSEDGLRLLVRRTHQLGMVDGRVSITLVHTWIFYDVDIGKPIGPGEEMILSRQGRVAAINRDGGVDIRDTFDARVISRLNTAAVGIANRALSANGSRFAVAQGSADRVTVELWNAETGDRVWTDTAERPSEDRQLAARHPIPQHFKVPFLQFSPGGQMLLGWDGSGDYDATVRVWDASTGRSRSIARRGGDALMQVRQIKGV